MSDPASLGDLEQVHAEILSAWNRQDAEAYARQFTQDAIVVGFDGSEMHGRNEIADALAGIFADHQVASYVRIVRDVRPIGTNSALLHATVGMVPPGGGDLVPDQNAVQLLVGVRHDGTWLAASLQNTPAALHGRPEAVDAMTEELRAAREH
ncbi:SgcJ/EcaC family oxidoreductase [Tenggerimyces flavus]|uniref:SgcJ/EcaC family oxidoreductase n=1 Tax=Tenggerimyces flavus TaxID=1708749 RepID=A0ABV7Y506_9ACTN|nr:SgcJ/EcaC family oxidoreductase [Tenggerimyces flavus]MBM7790335.1 uncharacterized protein (TIGR02246 family) [Tenggerimyces flavus]